MSSEAERGRHWEYSYQQSCTQAHLNMFLNIGYNLPEEDSAFRRHGFHLCSVALVAAHINPCCQTSPHYENTFQITPRHIASISNIKKSLPLCLYRVFFVVSSDYLLTEATQSHQLCKLLFVNQFVNLW